jgi:histidine triad (HIT) family protein
LRRLLSGEWPCAKVYEDELVFAFMDAGQVNDGHVIVATRSPFETLLDMDEDTAAALMRGGLEDRPGVQAVFRARRASPCCRPTARPAGRPCRTLHLHVLPRWSGDGVDLGLAAQGARPRTACVNWRRGPSGSERGGLAGTQAVAARRSVQTRSHASSIQSQRMDRVSRGSMMSRMPNFSAVRKGEVMFR